MFRRLCVVILGMAMLHQPALAQDTWFVDDDTCPSLGDGSNLNPFCSIQDAIDKATSGDKIIVALGTYNESINFLGKAITVRSTDPTDRAIVLATIIDASGVSAFHAVICATSEGSDTVLSGFTITGGDASGPVFPDGRGGGMLNFNSSPTVSYCTFSANFAAFGGGGMYNAFGAPAVVNCMFDTNSSDTGGGMYNDTADVTVTNCVFSRNSAGSASRGGGMYNTFSTPTVSFCSFDGNTAAIGGGMFNNQGTWSISDSTFTGNSGNGMYNNFTGATILRCEFLANNALGPGGGMFNIGSGIDVTQCTFLRNLAAGNGGAMSNTLTNPSLTDCTFRANVANGGSGGAIFNDPSSSPLTIDSTICGNAPDQVAGTAVNDLGGNIINDICPPPLKLIATGACCVDGNCIILNSVDCGLVGGSYQGDDTDCVVVICPAACPADFTGAGNGPPDGMVGIDEFLRVLASWGACP